MGREVGGGFRIGNTCTPVADSCWCMAKPIQYCKVISLQLKFKKKSEKYLFLKKKRLLNLIIKVTVMEFRIIPMKFILSFLLILLKNFLDILNFSSLEVYPRGIFSIIYKWIPSLTHGDGQRGLLISWGIILFDYLYNF